MKKILLMLVTALLALPSFAQVVTAKGVATVSYGDKLTPADVDRAYRAAQVASIERYFAEAGEAESENFEGIRPQVEGNLDKYIMSAAMLSEQDQPVLRKYSVSVRTELNVTKLRIALRGASKASQSGPAGNSQMVYVFLGRDVGAVKSFDDRVVKRAELKLESDIKASGSTRGTEARASKPTRSAPTPRRPAPARCPQTSRSTSKPVAAPTANRTRRPTACCRWPAKKPR